MHLLLILGYGSEGKLGNYMTGKYRYIKLLPQDLHKQFATVCARW